MIGALPRERLHRHLTETREFIRGTPVDALLSLVLGAVGLLGAFAGFLVMSTYTEIFIAAFSLAVLYGWIRHQGRTAYGVTLAMTAATFMTLGLIIVFLFVETWPVAQATARDVIGVSVPGVGLLFETQWDPVSPPLRYGLIQMIHGTFMVTVIATLVAAPLGVAAALFISEVAPPSIRETVKPAIEVLAGIPSIVYGFIGFTIISPFISEQFDLFGQGTYVFVGGVVGLMALPTVVSVAEDALNSVPESMKSGSLALGTTEWQTMTTITLPAAFSGVSAAVLLGVGRAIGETMAATVMLRNSPALPEPLYNAFGGYETLTSLIASRYGTATGNQEHALFAAGVVLFVTVLVISVGSQMIEARMKRKLGGQDA